MSRAKLYVGDALEVLRTLPDMSVQCCVTSPPYWGLRDYGTGRWDGGDELCDHTRGNPKQDHSHGTWEGTRDKQPSSVAGAAPQLQTCARCGATREDKQIGLERTPDEYVAKVVEIFREVRRVLMDDGTLWLNLGDSYAGSWGAQSRPNGKPMPLVDGGDMLSARQIEGHPGSTHTGSLKNTPGLKQKDLVGIPWRVAFALQADGWWLRSDIIWSKPNPMPESMTDRPTKAHEYVFLLSKAERYYYDADAIAEPTVKEGQVLHSYRSGAKDREDVSETNDRRTRIGLANWNKPVPPTKNARTVWAITTRPYPAAHFATFPPELASRCIKAGSKPSDTVLDPFGGSGTTAATATGLGRNAIHIDLNPEYNELARDRIGPMLCDEVAA